ncbi:hypothetical protein [Hoylesella pleuritidis]|uniref:hypothetical protein n=1 Tax=Hoylesella pleuritidis TaxID=407975 RepID=UPI0028E5C792|nr:hypothetical protein [Hoylesella pleuritidis]
MKQTELERRAYIRPMMKVINVEVEHLLAIVSGDHEDIGQGGTYGDAKRGYFDDEIEENEFFHP